MCIYTYIRIYVYIHIYVYIYTYTGVVESFGCLIIFYIGLKCNFNYFVLHIYTYTYICIYTPDEGPWRTETSHLLTNTLELMSHAHIF